MVRIFIVLTALTILACTEKRMVSEQELKDYIIDPSNGLRKQTSKNGIDIEVLYRPTELVLARQLDGLADPRERLKELNNFKDLSYFLIHLSRDGQEIENAYASDPDKFVNVISHLSSKMSQNIYLVHDVDTIPALDAVYTRMFGSATATSVMAVFNSDLKGKSGVLKFLLEDTELGLGQNKFEFDLSDIKAAPTLNMN